jgi:hypothetical protein
VSGPVLVTFSMNSSEREMAAFVRDSYLDLTMVSRREARSLESWASKLGIVMEAVTVALNRGVFLFYNPR